MESFFVLSNIFVFLLAGLVVFGIGFYATYKFVLKKLYHKKISSEKLRKTFFKALLFYYLLLVGYIIIISTVQGFPPVAILGIQLIIIVVNSLWFLTPAIEKSEKEVKLKTDKLEKKRKK